MKQFLLLSTNFTILTSEFAISDISIETSYRHYEKSFDKTFNTNEELLNRCIVLDITLCHRIISYSSDVIIKKDNTSLTVEDISFLLSKFPLLMQKFQNLIKNFVGESYDFEEDNLCTINIDDIILKFLEERGYIFKK